MKRYLCLGLAALLSFFVCIASTTTQAQEEGQKEEEGTEYSYGTVVKVSGVQLTVLEYDYDSNEEVEVTYTLDAGTKIQNVNSVKDIAAEDYVEIDYVVEGGKKIARVIAVEKEMEMEPEAETEEETTTDLGEETEY